MSAAVSETLRDMACELPEWFRISLTANDDMVERALQGFERAMKATLSATV